MAFISLGTIDKNIIPIIVGCICSVSLEPIIDIKGIMLIEYANIFFLLSIISKLLLFIPYIILKIRSKKSKVKSDVNNNINGIEYNYFDTRRGIKNKKYLYIFLSSILSFISGIIQFKTLGKLKVNSWIWDIMFYPLYYYLIYYLIFRIKFYKHHYLCIILIIILGLTLDLSLENLQYDLKNYWDLVLLRLLRDSIYSFNDVINKYIMEKKFCSIYELLSFSGIFLLIFFLIFALLNYYVFHSDYFEEYFNNFTYKDILLNLSINFF